MYGDKFRGEKEIVQTKIILKGAREHNLKNIDVEIPRNKLVVVTGLSGSGKSSLALDTIYAEGQRRYIESLSAYARQFLEKMKKPDIDYIEGLSPAISIDQKRASRNPRSTVGTVTEIYDYLRLLFARIGIPHCPKCGKRVSRQTVEQMVDRILESPKGSRIKVLAPIIRFKKGEHKKILENIQKKGFIRVRVDGEIYELSEDIKIDRYKNHNIEVVVDRLVVQDNIRSRLASSIETALNLSEGVVIIDMEGKGDKVFSEHFACPVCNINLPEIAPRIFSFNSPYGACPDCNGLGFKMEFDEDLIIPDRNKNILKGALAPWGEITGKYYYHLLKGLADFYGFRLETAFGELKPRIQHILLYGSGEERIPFRYQNDEKSSHWMYQNKFEGVVNNLKRRYKETKSEYIRTEIQKFMTIGHCPSCGGKRLRPESLKVTIKKRSIADISEQSVRESYLFFDTLKLKKNEETIARQILKEIKSRLNFLINVGLDYLTLSRTSSTLAGGENQRIRLATQIGSSLTGVLYILDEPSIGLHQKDNHKLLETLIKLRDMGNTLVVIEHDEDTMKRSDYIIDLGPGAGIHGGYIVAQGTYENIKKNKKSLTGKYLSQAKKIEIPKKRRKGNGGKIKIFGAEQYNLKNIDVSIPLGRFTCVTGVSGSGKSTLVEDIIYKALARKIYQARVHPGKYKKIEGMENIDKVIIIDQSPIGRTSRSNPITYVGGFTPIREIFAKTKEARMRGYKLGRFSFNVKGGRCEACQGAGIVKIEMYFLSDIFIPCEVCKAKRFNRETLEVKYKGKDISQVLDMTIEEALQFFDSIPKIKRKLQTLYDVGLGYIKLGQSASTLSGGEAQRVKLAKELSIKSSGNTLYLLDEPTTGLHFDDVRKLLKVLDRLVNAGNTILIIEHNLDVIKSADYIIDLGPGGGDEGGRVIAEGTPEEVAANPNSFTGEYLKKVLK